MACDFTGTRELIYNRYKFSMLCVERGDLIKDVCREHSFLWAGREKEVGNATPIKLIFRKMVMFI